MTDEKQKPGEDGGFLDTLYSTSLHGSTSASDVDLRRLLLLLLMSVHRDLFLATFPRAGGFDTTALEQEGWFKPGEIPNDKLRSLATHRDTLVMIQGAWKELAGYEDPPCPTLPILQQIATFLRSL